MGLLQHSLMQSLQDYPSVEVMLYFNNGEMLQGVTELYKKLAVPLALVEVGQLQSMTDFVNNTLLRGHSGLMEESIYDVLYRVFSFYKPVEIMKTLSGFTPTVNKPEDFKLRRVTVLFGENLAEEFKLPLVLAETE